MQITKVRSVVEHSTRELIALESQIRTRIANSSIQQQVKDEIDNHLCCVFDGCEIYDPQSPAGQKLNASQPFFKKGMLKNLRALGIYGLESLTRILDETPELQGLTEWLKLMQKANLMNYLRSPFPVHQKKAREILDSLELSYLLPSPERDREVHQPSIAAEKAETIPTTAATDLEIKRAGFIPKANITDLFSEECLQSPILLELENKCKKIGIVSPFNLSSANDLKRTIKRLVEGIGLTSIGDGKWQNKNGIICFKPSDRGDDFTLEILAYKKDGERALSDERVPRTEFLQAFKSDPRNLEKIGPTFSIKGETKYGQFKYSIDSLTYRGGFGQGVYLDEGSEIAVRKVYLSLVNALVLLVEPHRINKIVNSLESKQEIVQPNNSQEIRDRSIVNSLETKQEIAQPNNSQEIRDRSIANYFLHPREYPPQTILELINEQGFENVIINGRSLRNIERSMKPEGLSYCGFLGADESLQKILEHDNKTVLSHNLTHRDLLFPILVAANAYELQQKGLAHIDGNFIFNGETYKFKGQSFMGCQESPFNVAHRGYSDIWVIDSKDNYVRFPILLRDLIPFGFYEGEGTPYRLAPEDIIEFFKLQNLYE